MWTASSVRTHFMRRPKNTLVTRRDLLHYGTQFAVDSAIRELRKSGTIIRVCCGVYLRPHSTEPMPTADEIAEARISAFHRVRAKTALDVAAKHELVGAGESELVYEVNSSTSKFRVFRSRDKGDCTVYLRARAARKMQLDLTPARRAIKALWWLGEDEVSPKIIERAVQNFEKADRDEFRISSRFMPGWLSDPVHVLFD